MSKGLIAEQDVAEPELYRPRLLGPADPPIPTEQVAAGRDFTRRTGLRLGDPSAMRRGLGAYKVHHDDKHDPAWYFSGPHPPSCDPRIACYLRWYDVLARQRRASREELLARFMRVGFDRRQARALANDTIRMQGAVANTKARRKALLRCARLLRLVAGDPACRERIDNLFGKIERRSLCAWSARLERASSADGWPAVSAATREQKVFKTTVRFLRTCGLLSGARGPLSARDIRDLFVWSGFYRDPDEILVERVQRAITRL
ncbi:MAG: hypothetical protein JXB32_14445 [Deltaproteobacteria bacterium]|nr:hypothetical protein [Deltaproteobacteria bacterium]